MTCSVRAASLALVTLLALAVPVRASEATLETFDACWNLVQRRFYDRDLHGVDWQQCRELFRPLADEAQPGAELHLVMNEMLAVLGASHTTILKPWVYDQMMNELRNRRSLGFGIQLEEAVAGQLFIRALYEGGPAEDSGLRIGDRVLALDGVPVFQSSQLLDAGYDPAMEGAAMYFVEPPSSGELTVHAQRTPRPGSRFQVTMSARPINGVDAARNSISAFEVDGVRLGTLHLWFCQRGVPELLREALCGPLRDCDALVLDVRGRGGYANVVGEILAQFRGGSSRRRPVWDKPVVFLIDSRSRSAKEILSYQVRRKGLGLLVGERTEGAVLGAMFYSLPDGSYLELAGLAVPVDGVSLEGVGVAPDVEVTFESPWLAGFDPIFQRGCEEAVELVRAVWAGGGQPSSH